MRKILLLMQALLLLTPALFAQKNISGKILDDQGSPIPFASITLKDKSKGAITDAEGNFSLPNIPDGSVIIVTSQGYLSKQITVSTGMNWIISMQPAVNQLKEVVVTTALGVSRSKKTVGYATQQLGTEKISQTKVADLNTAIAGKIAGLQIRGGSGAKFGTSTIHLRGINTLSGASPIYVVDGVILTNASGINPDDIESLNVLKGPAATALYGQRGSEGAVIITSKKAAKKGIGVDINHTTTFENVYVLPEYQNEYGGGSGQDWLTFHYDPAIHPANLSVLDGAKYYRYDVDESWGPKMDGTLYAPWYAWDASDVDFGKQKPFNPQPNNVRDFYNAGIGNNTTVALSKATAVSNMRLSFTNLTRTGVIPNSKQQKN
ncbi:MAG: carboxypeptidase-like regulatory domain-containing protein, partial [Chitinophagaceae bacterium]|nr:carboxypeptidase-like regulatory domain-containing protein [Chitinophagaceae bacterium]